MTIQQRDSILELIKELIDIAPPPEKILSPTTESHKNEAFLDNLLRNLKGLEIDIITFWRDLEIIYKTEGSNLNIIKECIKAKKGFLTGRYDTMSSFKKKIISYRKQIEVWDKKADATYLDKIDPSVVISRFDQLESSLEQVAGLKLLSEELTTIAAVYKENLKGIKEDKKTRTQEYNKLNELIEKEKTQLLGLKEASKLMNEQLEKDKKTLEEQAKYLGDLIGKGVGKSLYHTFDKRKSELNRPVIFWGTLTILVTIGLSIFTYFLFYGIDFTKIGWTVYLANTLKLIPMVIVLFFCIRQYQRERNFQEEYAFKSAVALTIDAYSKQIEDKDKRDDMIIESVSKVYDSPIAKHISKEKIKTQSMLKGIEVMKDTVTGVTKDAVDIVKAAKN